MNKLGYQVNWTDTRKYITYTTPEGYKCRDNKLYDEKYLKGEMENEFNGRIKTKESINNTNTITNANTNESRIYNNKSRFMGNNSSMDTEHPRQNKKYGIQNGQSAFNGVNNSKYGEGFKGYSTNSNQETNGGISRRIKETSKNKMETYNTTDRFLDCLEEIVTKGLSQDDLHQAKRCFLDYLGATLAGAKMLGNRGLSLVGMM